jgi:hypothetical protein
MNSFIQNILKLEKKLSAEKGNFLFFALAELENRQNKWDVIVSASWLPSREIEAISVMTYSIFEILDKNELSQLSRVVILNADEPFIKEVIKKSGGRAILSDVFINGLEIRNIHIISNHAKYKDDGLMVLNKKITTQKFEEEYRNAA